MMTRKNPNLWIWLLGGVGCGVWLLLRTPAPLSTLLLFSVLGLWLSLGLRGILQPLALPAPLRLPVQLMILMLLILSALQFRQVTVRSTLDVAAALLLGAWLLLGLLLKTGRPFEHIPTPAQTEIPTRVRLLPTVCGVLLLGAVAAGGSNTFGFDALLPIGVELLFLVAGIGLIVVGLSGVRREAAAHPTETVRAVPRFTLPTAALLLITLLALLLRVWNLELAVHLFVDEINFALPARLLYLGEDRPLLLPFSGVFAFPHLYPYVQSFGIGLFGMSLTAIRLFSAVLGTLTIPAVYWLAREFCITQSPQSPRTVDRRSAAIFALLAALLLAVFPPHIHYSRLALNNIADPLFGVLALAGLLRGLRTGDRWSYAVGGVCLGLTQYFYEGGRLIYPPLVVIWLFGVVVLGRRYGIAIRRLWLFFAAALIVAAPIYITLLGRGIPLASRLEREAIGGSYWQRKADVDQLQPFSEHTLLPLLIYVREADRSLFYGGEQPLVLVFAVPFLLLGTGVSVWRVILPGARAGYFLLLTWSGLVYFGNALLALSAISARYVVVFPALALLIAVGVREVWLWIAVDAHQWQVKQMIRLGFSGGVLALCLAQAIYYFDGHLTFYNQQTRPQIDATDVLFRARDHLPPETGIHIISPYPLNEGLLKAIGVYLLYPRDFTLLTTETLSDEYLVGLQRDVDHAFFIAQDDAVALSVLRRHFTLGNPQFSPFMSVPIERQFVLYLAARQEDSAE